MSRNPSGSFRHALDIAAQVAGIVGAIVAIIALWVT